MLVLAAALLVLSMESVPEAAKAFEKGNQLLRQKKPAEARRQFETAVRLDPAHARAWYELARLQAASSEALAARQSCEAAIRADAKLFEAYLLLLSLAQAERDWKGMIQISERLCKRNPVDYPAAFFAHAVGHYQLKNYTAAEESLRAGQAIDPERTTPENWRLLGLILANRGDYAGAAAQWREYLKYAPSFPAAREVQGWLANAEKRAGAAPDGPVFRSDTELVLVRFQVSPKRGRFLTDVRAQDIEIRENGVPQKTALFEGGRFHPRTLPLEIALLFDASSSVQTARNLNPHVFHESLLDEYENASIAIYGFSDQLVRFTGPTRHPQILKKAMDRVLTIPPGITPLFRYIAETVQWAAARPGAIRMLVVFSDGESYGPGDAGMVEKAVKAARERGVSIYPVVLHRPSGTAAIPGAASSGNNDPLSAPPQGFLHYPTAAANMESVQNFSLLARETGGESFEAVASNEAVAEILKRMARRVQFDYVAGYYPASTGGSKRHEVEVVMKAKERGTIIGGKRIVVH